MYNLKGDNMKCHACKEEYSDEFDFCPFCGAYPKKFCPQCFKEVNDGEEICSSCGSKLLPFEVFNKFHDLREKALDYRDKDNFKKSSEYFEKILDIWPNVEEINFLEKQMINAFQINKQTLESENGLKRFSEKFKKYFDLNKKKE